MEEVRVQWVKRRQIQRFDGNKEEWMIHKRTFKDAPDPCELCDQRVRSYNRIGHAQASRDAYQLDDSHHAYMTQHRASMDTTTILKTNGSLVT